MKGRKKIRRKVDEKEIKENEEDGKSVEIKYTEKGK